MQGTFNHAMTLIQSKPIWELIKEISESKNEAAIMHINQFRGIEYPEDNKMLAGISAELSNRVMVFATDNRIKAAYSKDDDMMKWEDLEDHNIFMRIYEYFGNMSNVRHTQIYADTFWSFMNEVVHSSRLIIDKLVEDDIFGENWEQLFLETTNKLAELVLYDPSKINYSLASESQQKFQNYLLEPVKRIIAYQKGHFYSRQSLLSGSDSDDEI